MPPTQVPVSNAAPDPRRIQNRRRRSWRRKLLFSGILATIIFVCQEMVFRLIFPLPAISNFNRIDYTRLAAFSSTFRDSEYSGLSNVGIRFESEPDGFDFIHTLNLNGFRTPDFDVEPPRNCRRIVFIGDSFTEGHGTSDQDTIPARFADEIAAQMPVEVINLGISGSDVIEYESLLLDTCEGLKHIDTVFLILCYNDLPMPRIVWDAKGVLVKEFEESKRWVPRSLAAAYRLAQGRTLPTRFYSGPHPFLAAVPARNNPFSDPDNDPPQRINPAILDAMRRGKFNPWLAGSGLAILDGLRIDLSEDQRTEMHLRYCANLCKRANAKLMIVYVPYYAVANSQYLRFSRKLGGPDFDENQSLEGPEFRRQQAHLSEVTHKLGIPFLDTTDLLSHAEKTVGHMFWPYDNHCNPEGYRLIARAAAKFWLQNRFSGVPR